MSPPTSASIKRQINYTRGEAFNNLSDEQKILKIEALDRVWQEHGLSSVLDAIRQDMLEQLLQTELHEKGLREDIYRGTLILEEIRDYFEHLFVSKQFIKLKIKKRQKKDDG